jgi:hypothetical protein
LREWGRKVGLGACGLIRIPASAPLYRESGGRAEGARVYSGVHRAVFRARGQRH